MKKFSKKGVLLFAAAMALCAFALPATAGALSWTAVGTEHTLASPDFGFTFTIDLGVQFDSRCTSSSLTVTATNATTLEIDNASFGGNCTVLVNGGSAGFCTMDSASARLPWTATLLSASDVRIDGFHLNWTFTQSGGCPANLPGSSLTITGSTTGTWSNAAGNRELILSNATGLVSHGPLPFFGNGTPMTARGTFREAAQTLTVDN